MTMVTGKDGIATTGPVVLVEKASTSSLQRVYYGNSTTNTARSSVTSLSVAILKESTGINSVSNAASVTGTIGITESSNSLHYTNTISSISEGNNNGNNGENSNNDNSNSRRTLPSINPSKLTFTSVQETSSSYQSLAATTPISIETPDLINGTGENTNSGNGSNSNDSNSNQSNEDESNASGSNGNDSVVTPKTANPTVSQQAPAITSDRTTSTISLSPYEGKAPSNIRPDYVKFFFILIYAIL